ncbi:MAG: M56 family metallopeptidase [Patescibacteria group bacterium]
MKSSRVFTFLSLGSLAGIFFLIVFFIRLWPHAISTLQNTIHAVSYACQVAWADITRDQIVYASLGIVLLALFTTWLGYNAYRAMRMARTVRLQRLPVPVRVFSIAADADLECSRLTIAADQRAYAMTIGLRWPEVVVSSQALRTLTAAQLQAVLEHEAHHVRMREPLRRLGLTLALLWVPFAKLRRQLRDAYIAASEVEADEHVRDQNVLGSALLQLVTPPVAAAGFSPLDARVERLVNPHFKQSGAFAVQFTLVALVIATGAIVFAPKSIAAVFGEHPSPSTAVHLTICREEHERMLQSQVNTCGRFSTPQTCLAN